MHTHTHIQISIKQHTTQSLLKICNEFCLSCYKYIQRGTDILKATPCTNTYVCIYVCTSRAVLHKLKCEMAFK